MPSVCAPASPIRWAGSRSRRAPRCGAANGSAIAGLYAIGACTGGLEGGPMAGYIGGLCKATSLGYIASEQIGAKLPAHR